MIHTPMDDTSAPSPDEFAAALEVARSQRVAVFVVAFNAESLIRDTLRRIPEALRECLTSIYVIDDSSRDETVDMARTLRAEIPNLRAGFDHALDRGDVGAACGYLAAAAAAASSQSNHGIDRRWAAVRRAGKHR